MAEIFNIDETFEIAEQIERNGARFYRKAAGIFDASRAKSLLMDLATMEDQHEKVFHDIRRKLKDKTGDESGTIEEEPARYLKAVASGYVFPVSLDPSEKLKGDEKLADIINFALEIEKDSIVFYLGIREAMPEDFGKLEIHRIIKEELRHITILTDLMHKTK